LSARLGPSALDWSCGPLADGLACYRGGQFFDAHEHWEGVWLNSDEPDRTFLQSLIQVSAAFHHLQRGNRMGARSLLARGLRRLERYPDQYGGVAVAAVRESMRAWLRALEQEECAPPADFPRIG
jgi:uncharacterized protein